MEITDPAVMVFVVQEPVCARKALQDKLVNCVQLAATAPTAQVHLAAFDFTPESEPLEQH